MFADRHARAATVSKTRRIKQRPGKGGNERNAGRVDL